MTEIRETSVTLTYEEIEVELMRRYVLTSADDDATVMARTDDEIVAEFVRNAYENMLDNCYDLRSAGELTELPDGP